MTAPTVPGAAGGGLTRAHSALDPHAIALTVAYDGMVFAGFARQPGQITVQGRLEAALSIALRRDIVTAVAGRTDAGVHSLGNVVSFEALGDDPEDGALLRSLNALVGEGIAIRQIRRARAGFSARFDAIEREYRYRIVTGPVPPLFLGHIAWWERKPLDLDAMRSASACLVGERDFRSFCVSASSLGKRTFRCVKSIEIHNEQHLGEQCTVVRIVGNAFLHSMVRVVVGSLVEVGTGRRDEAWLVGALAACERAAAGPTAPAHGLTLWRVGYRDGVWL